MIFYELIFNHHWLFGLILPGTAVTADQPSPDWGDIGFKVGSWIVGIVFSVWAGIERRKAEKAKEETEGVKNQLVEKDEKVDKNERDIQVINDYLTTLKEELKQEKSINQNVQEELKEKRAAQEQLQLKVSSMDNQLSKTIKVLTDTQQELVMTQTRLSSTRAELTTTQDELAKVQLQLNTTLAINEELNQELTEYKSFKSTNTEGS